MDMIDLRSDTVTLPTDEMLEAMKTAVVGDDILGEDPTVQKLERMGAQLFGKEAALLTVSGTMANQIAVMVYTKRGQEVIVGQESHIYNLEVGALSVLSQVQPRPIVCPEAIFDVDQLEEAITKPDIQTSETGLICIENTYNLNKGLLMDSSNIAQIKALADKRQIPVYMDGARIFNAAAALGTEVKDLVKDVDAVQVCLTKGLSVPIGSLLIGSTDFIEEARRIRQRLGGGMRQAGVIAAAGIVALENMIDRLADDNAMAKELATGLFEVDQRLLTKSEVQTNILTIDTEAIGIKEEKLLEELLQCHIRIKRVGQHRFRMVTHRHVTGKHVSYVVDCFRKILSGRRE